MSETTVSQPAASVTVRMTRLHRPSIPAQVLPRTRLTQRLEDGFHRPLTLVSAPAGFGKTLVTSQWCETSDRPSAWLSLDSSIDDARWFVAHLVAAIQVACPDSMETTAKMVAAPQVPDERALVIELSNELDELDQRILIVLDDYHSIKNSAVHTLVAELLRHPPLMAHFVIITRRDPPLPLAALRAKGQLTEVRMADLAFTENELQLFIQAESDRLLSAEELSSLHESTEGWPAGARLALEAIRAAPHGSEILGAGFLDRGTQEYLASEVIDGLPPAVRRHLVVASLFNQFNAELCEALTADVMTGPTSMTANEFIDWIIRHNLFIVPLDAQGVWFRFHHLFARLLDRWRTSHLLDLGLSEDRARRRAAHHLEHAGLIEDAIAQLISASDDEGVARLVSTHGNELIETEGWTELTRLLAVVPADIVDRDPRLVVLSAWIAGEVRSQFADMSHLLDRADKLLDEGVVVGPGAPAELRGQIAALRGAYVHMVDAEFERAIADAQTGQRLLADRPGRNLVFAYVLEVVALAGAGRAAEAHRLASSVVGDERFAGAPYNPLIYAMPYAGWLSGNLGEVEQYAEQLLAIGERFGLDDTRSTGHYFLGIAAYERNRLQEAEQHLAIAVDLRYQAPSGSSTHASIALALTEWSQGRTTEADATAAAMLQHVLSIQSEFLHPVAVGFLAELDLRCGRHTTAHQWALTAVPDHVRHRFLFYEPTPTRIEAFLTASSTTERAVELLDDALKLAQHRHHEPILIRLLGLRALALSQAGREEQALETMESAIVRSHRSGIVRRLADLGPSIIPIVSRVQVTDDVLEHAAAILAAIDPHRSAGASDKTRVSGVTSVAGELTLTDRELDVLRLLAARYSNKEIAAELFIAPSTVKKRTVTLYDKLNVHGRREAVAKASALGYLSE